jgi:5-formyltetrahydrofolate cyclo-ligase
VSKLRARQFLRTRYRKIRSKTPRRRVKKNSRRIGLELLRFLGSKPLHIAFYAAIGKEINLGFFLSLALPHQFLLPRVMPGKTLEMVPINSDSELEIGPFEILSPPRKISGFEIEEIDVVLVPGLCFDRHGTRLGTGGGYYDRFLTKFTGKLIGVCHSSQVFRGRIPVLDHDIPMQWIIHENGVLSCL